MVRCTWATQQARLAQVAALVQNPGVTYDIPLAEVTAEATRLAVEVPTGSLCMHRVK